MRSYFNYSLLVLVFVIYANYSRAQDEGLKDAVDSLDSYFKTMLKDWTDTPGFAIGVVKDTSVIFLKGYGYRDVENKLPVDENTKFGIASTTKSFTSTCFGVLMDKGLLNLNEAIKKSIPDFKMFDAYATEHMTFEDFLCHRSGLPQHYILSQGRDISRKDLFDALPYLENNAQLREKFQYNNLTYELNGYLVERISGETWEDFTKKNILGPLEMRSTGFFHSKVYEEPNFAKSYAYDYLENKYSEADYLQFFPAKNPSGGMYSSVSDLCNWIIMNLNEGEFDEHEIVSGTYLQNAHKIHIGNQSDLGWNFNGLGYGLGWFINSYHGNLVISHPGGGQGYDSHLILIPGKKMGITVLSNTRNGTAFMVMRMLMDRIFELDFFDWSNFGYNRWRARYIKEAENESVKKEITETKLPDNAGNYTGKYMHPGYGMINIVLRDDVLVGERAGIEFVLHHKKFNIFDLACDENVWYDSRILQFHYNMKGEIEKLICNFEPSVNPIEFRKIHK